MSAIEVHCTHCRHTMAIESKLTRQPIRCAKCDETFQVKLKRAANEAPTAATKPKTDDSRSAPAASGSSRAHKAMEMAQQLLPPRFTVTNEVAEKVATQFRNEQPDGIDLGIDTEVTRIEHGGQRVEVLSLTREQKQRRKNWRVAFVFTLGVIVLVCVCLLLLKQSGN